MVDKVKFNKLFYQYQPQTITKRLKMHYLFRILATQEPLIHIQNAFIRRDLDS